MSVLYRECIGETEVDHYVDIISTGTCTFDTSYWVSTSFYEDYTATLDIEALESTPAVNDYDVRIEIKYKIQGWYTKQDYLDGDPAFFTQYPGSTIYITIPQGSVYGSDSYLCKQFIENGSSTYTRQTLETITVKPQSPTVSCAPDPPGCAIEITGYTTNAPTERGEDDGSLSIGLSGMTGSTITWTIDGDPISDTDPHITVTGLTAGTYSMNAVEGPCSDSQSIVVSDGEFRTGDFTVISPQDQGYTVATENPVLVNIATAVNSYSPQYSISQFTCSGDISNVYVQFDLTFPYIYSATFQSKGFPDRPSYFLESILTDDVGVPIGTNSAEEIMTSFAETLQKDTIINRLFYIYNSGNTVTLSAKEYNEQYDLSSDNVTITGSNLSIANIQSGVAQYDGQLSANYSVYCELFVDETSEFGVTESEETYLRAAELELPYQSDNLHQFDMSPVLKNFVSSPKIDFSFTGSTFMGDMLASYYVKYGERYPLIPNSNTKKKRYKGTTDFGWCINSALNFEDANDMGSYIPDAGETSGVTFLNTAENTKYAHRDGKEFLNIVFRQAYPYPLAVFVDINMYDGTVHEDVKLYDITTSGSTNNFGGVAIMSVAYDCTCISDYETGGAKIRSVDAQVRYTKDGVNWLPYSEVKTMRYELDEQPSNFNVTFLNKLGTYETYSFVGERVNESEITRENYQRPFELNTDGSANLGFQYNSTYDTDYTKVFILNTGIIDLDTYEFLQGLLNSTRIYHYDDVHQTYLNILDQTSTRSTNTNEYSIQIVVQETINENNVSQ